MLVLAFVVLISAIIVGFFMSASGTRREVAGYESGMIVRQLSDLATNVVIGQIADGTKSWEVPAATKTGKGSGARLTYATQPGMVRTYDSSGTPRRAFKLYSSATMVTHPGSEWIATDNLSSEVPPNWVTAKPVMSTPS